MAFRSGRESFSGGGEEEEEEAEGGQGMSSSPPSLPRDKRDFLLHPSPRGSSMAGEEEEEGERKASSLFSTGASSFRRGESTRDGDEEEEDTDSEEEENDRHSKKKGKNYESEEEEEEDEDDRGFIVRDGEEEEEEEGGSDAEKRRSHEEEEEEKEAEDFLWGARREEGEEDEEGENDLLEADDYLQASSSSAAGATSATVGRIDVEGETLDEEVPYAPKVLAKDSEARGRKEKLLLAAFNALTHTEIIRERRSFDEFSASSFSSSSASILPPTANRLSASSTHSRHSSTLHPHTRPASSLSSSPTSSAASQSLFSSPSSLFPEEPGRRRDRNAQQVINEGEGRERRQALRRSSAGCPSSSSSTTASSSSSFSFSQTPPSSSTTSSSRGTLLSRGGRRSVDGLSSSSCPNSTDGGYRDGVSSHASSSSSLSSQHVSSLPPRRPDFTSRSSSSSFPSSSPSSSSQHRPPLQLFSQSSQSSFPASVDSRSRRGFSSSSSQNEKERSSFLHPSSSSSFSSTSGSSSPPPVMGAKVAKLMHQIFGKRKPVGRFGTLSASFSSSRSSSSSLSQRSREREKEAAMSSSSSSCRPFSDEGDERREKNPSDARGGGPGEISYEDGVHTQREEGRREVVVVDGEEEEERSRPVESGSGGVFEEVGGHWTSIVVAEEAVRQLKDINLLLKREGCNGSLRQQKTQDLYDFEDGHMLYQHPRFCISAIFREKLVLRRLSPLWLAIAARYDAIEGSEDTEQIAQQENLILQLLRSLTFLSIPPPIDWIQYWMKFAPWLDNMKRLDDARKKEKKHLEENRQKCKRLGIEQSEVERRALARIEEEDLILQDEPVQEERRKRSRIIMKYYKGLQDVKKALCCSKLWILLTSIYIDKQDFIDRGGRTSAEQQRHDDLVSQREKLYEKERQLKERLHALQKEKKDQEEQEEKDQEDEEHQRRGGGGGRLKRNVETEKEEREEALRSVKEELEEVRGEIFKLTETLHSLNRSTRGEVEKSQSLLQNLKEFLCAVLLMPPRSQEGEGGAGGDGQVSVVAQQQGSQISLVLSMLQQKHQQARLEEGLSAGGSSSSSSSSSRPSSPPGLGSSPLQKSDPNATTGGRFTYPSLLHLMLRDTEIDLFTQMQKSFSLVEMSSTVQGGFEDSGVPTVGGLGRWAVTHVHASLMEKIWLVLRTVHALFSSLPPLHFADLVAEIVTGSTPGKTYRTSPSPSSSSCSPSSLPQHPQEGRRSSTFFSRPSSLQGQKDMQRSAAPAIPTRSQSRGIGGALSATETLIKMKNEKFLELSRLDPLRARALLLNERVIEAQRRNRKLARVRVLRDQARFVDYERLFSFRSLSLRPFDLEDIFVDHEEGKEDIEEEEREGKKKNAREEEEENRRTLGEKTSTAPTHGGVYTAPPQISSSHARHRQTSCRSLASSSSSLSSSAWRLRACLLADMKGGEEKVLEIHKLVNGFIGIDELFTAPVNSETDENDLYSGRFYSLAFLIEAGVKELLREVDTDYHTPWDAELLLDLIAWIFAYEVTYFKGVNRLRLLQKQRQKLSSSQSRMKEESSFSTISSSSQEKNSGVMSGSRSLIREASSIILLDRIDMIFCLQGFETALIQQFITDSLHKAVKIQDLSRKSRPMLRTALQCMRQLLRLLQVHIHSKKEDIVEAVKAQLSSWIGRGIIGEVAYVMKCYKASSFEPEVFLYALEISLVYIQLIQAFGGEIEVLGLGKNGLRMASRKKDPKMVGRSAGDDLMGGDDEELPHNFPLHGDGTEGGGSWSRKVTVDDVVREFMKGEIISQCMHLLSNFLMNPVAINSALISFFEYVLQYKNKRPENICLFFDLSYFLIFQQVLNTPPQSRCDPRFSWIIDFSESIVEAFFCLWGGEEEEEGLLRRDHGSIGRESLSSPSKAGDENKETRSSVGDMGTCHLSAELTKERKRGGEEEQGRTYREANAFLPIELLFSKKKSTYTGRGGEGGGVLDFFSPVSDGSLLSVYTNYEEGSDAKVLQHMNRQVLEKGFSNPIDAVGDCRRELEEQYGGYRGGGGGRATKFDPHEDEILLREYMIYRDINHWDRYIATTLGKTAKAVRKRLQQIYLSHPERLPPDFSSSSRDFVDEEEDDDDDERDPGLVSSPSKHRSSSLSGSERDESDPTISSSSLRPTDFFSSFSSPLYAPREALSSLPPLLRAVVAFWGLCLRRKACKGVVSSSYDGYEEVEEDHENLGYINQQVKLFLEGLTKNFQDACRLRQVMMCEEEEEGQPPRRSLGIMKEDVTVEDTTDAKEISLDLLDGEEFAHLMHAMGAEKKKWRERKEGQHQEEEEESEGATVWIISSSVPQEVLEASVRRLHELSQLQKEEIEEMASECIHKALEEKRKKDRRNKEKQRRIPRRPFVFNSAALAEALLNFRLHLQKYLEEKEEEKKEETSSSSSFASHSSSAKDPLFYQDGEKRSEEKGEEGTSHNKLFHDSSSSSCDLRRSKEDKEEDQEGKKKIMSGGGEGMEEEEEEEEEEASSSFSSVERGVMDDLLKIFKDASDRLPFEREERRKEKETRDKDVKGGQEEDEEEMKKQKKSHGGADAKGGREEEEEEGLCLKIEDLSWFDQQGEAEQRKEDKENKRRRERKIDGNLVESKAFRRLLVAMGCFRDSLRQGGEVDQQLKADREGEEEEGEKTEGKRRSSSSSTSILRWQIPLDVDDEIFADRVAALGNFLTKDVDELERIVSAIQGHTTGDSDRFSRRHPHGGERDEGEDEEECVYGGEEEEEDSSFSSLHSKKMKKKKKDHRRDRLHHKKKRHHERRGKDEEEEKTPSPLSGDSYLEMRENLKKTLLSFSSSSKGRESGGDDRKERRKRGGGEEEEKRRAGRKEGVVFPQKPTTKQRYTLALKLLRWREFLEAEESHREILHGDRPLQRLLQCLQKWNEEREERLLTSSSSSSFLEEDEEDFDRRHPGKRNKKKRQEGVPHLVLTTTLWSRGEEEERERDEEEEEEGEVSSSSDGRKERDDGEASRRRRRRVREEGEGSDRVRVYEGLLPGVSAVLWVCAALGGKPVMHTDNRVWVWHKDEKIFPSSWMRKQLRILEIVLLNPHMQTVEGVQAEVDLIKEALDREEKEQEETMKKRNEEAGENSERSEEEEDGEDERENRAEEEEEMEEEREDEEKRKKKKRREKKQRDEMSEGEEEKMRSFRDKDTVMGGDEEEEDESDGNRENKSDEEEEDDDEDFELRASESEEESSEKEDEEDEKGEIQRRDEEKKEEEQDTTGKKKEKRTATERKENKEEEDKVYRQSRQVLRKPRQEKDERTREEEEDFDDDYGEEDSFLLYDKTEYRQGVHASSKKSDRMSLESTSSDAFDTWDALLHEEEEEEEEEEQRENRSRKEGRKKEEDTAWQASTSRHHHHRDTGCLDTGSSWGDGHGGADIIECLFSTFALQKETSILGGGEDEEEEREDGLSSDQEGKERPTFLITETIDEEKEDTRDGLSQDLHSPDGLHKSRKRRFEEEKRNLKRSREVETSGLEAGREGAEKEGEEEDRERYRRKKKTKDHLAEEGTSEDNPEEKEEEDMKENSIPAENASKKEKISIGHKGKKCSERKEREGEEEGDVERVLRLMREVDVLCRDENDGSK